MCRSHIRLALAGRIRPSRAATPPDVRAASNVDRSKLYMRALGRPRLLLRTVDGRVLATCGRMDIVTWIIVGLVAGSLASLVLRGSGFGIIGNILLGIVGAVVGAWGFRELGVRVPIDGLAGTIFVAFVGAVVLLLVLHLVRRGTRS